MASPRVLQSNRLSCSDKPCALALVVGLSEVTAQYSGMCLENSSVPISRALLNGLFVGHAKRPQHHELKNLTDEIKIGQRLAGNL